MVRHLILGAVLTAITGTALTGCGGGDSDEPPVPPEVAWAGRFCTTIGENTQLSLPQVDLNKPAEAKDALVAFLDSVSTKLKAQAGRLQSAGAPPVSGGQTAMDQALKKLNDTQAAVNAANTKLRATKVTNQAGLKTAFTRAGQDMAKFGSYQGPVRDLGASNPTLGQAFSKAPACKSQVSG
ncbi:hypothetical protein DPM19_32545 [Actinomadura craniellae]|uniref:Small secreted protein n=1 Tax=Actinomadura craniellae TaxID=2231787 RepID=A0A365GW64_9ACTN|nr:hypothetical protein [Actinomadura craniellae]RAY11034.1 hypothetical protein DPM19_32545 [Actinomadura craniellae]